MLKAVENRYLETCKYLQLESRPRPLYLSKAHFVTSEW